MSPLRAARLHTFCVEAIRLLKGVLRYLEQLKEEFRLESETK